MPMVGQKTDKHDRLKQYRGFTEIDSDGDDVNAMDDTENDNEEP